MCKRRALGLSQVVQQIGGRRQAVCDRPEDAVDERAQLERALKDGLRVVRAPPCAAKQALQRTPVEEFHAAREDRDVEVSAQVLVLRL
jgi:hypothetical protein